MYNGYDNMINMPRHVSTEHPPMSIYKRAAQFAPFAALSGYDEAITESARYTEEKIEIADDLKYILDCKMNKLVYNINSQPEASITFFIPDEKKKGGRYVTLKGRIKSIDSSEKIITMMDSSKINIEDVVNIDSDIFLE